MITPKERSPGKINTLEIYGEADGEGLQLHVSAKWGATRDPEVCVDSVKTW